MSLLDKTSSPSTDIVGSIDGPEGYETVADKRVKVVTERGLTHVFDRDDVF